jgi:uncharacterized protein (DUF58 family)
VPGSDATFPLVPRRRLVGLSFGGLTSTRRGTGSDVAGSRPYQTCDNVDWIDWNASARRSSARETDEFVVRVTYAEEAPRVVVLCDRRPEMKLYPPPWLDKAEAMRRTVELIVESAAVSRGFIGYLDYASGEPFWRPPKSERELWEIKERHLLWPDFDAPQDTLGLALEHLAQHRVALPSGSFLFIVSDFLVPPPEGAWTRALGHLWDVVPVVIQDPVWEQSFPDVGGIVVPFEDPATGRLLEVRLTAREAQERREANERRLQQLTDDLRAHEIEPVLVATADPGEILTAFLAWTEERLYRRTRLW